jgi:hypothetical protein
MRPRSLPALLAVALLAAPTARADDAAAARSNPKRGLMTVTLVEGPVTAAPKGGGEAQPVVVGEQLKEGDQVQTGRGGRLEILLATGTVIRIGESTQAELREAPPEGGRFRLRLLVGSFWAKVSKLLSGDRFEVETENAVAGVRGTEFRVEAGAAGQADLLRVYEGVVQVDHQAGQWSHRVTPGNELRFHKSEATAPPAAFDPSSEAGHPFMKWVREGGGKAHELIRDPKERKEKERRGIRERLHDLIHR